MINNVKQYACINNKVRVLLIEDQPDHVELIRDMLAEVKSINFHLEHAARLSTGLELLSRGKIDVVLLDLSLPDSEGVNTFRSIHARSPEVPVVVISAYEDETFAVSAVHAGAQDYLVKGRVDSDLLGRSICHALERNRMLGTLRRSEQELRIRNKIAEIFLTTPDNEMYGEVLQIILESVASKYGIFGYIDQNGALVCPSMTRDVWDKCQIPHKDIVFPREMWHGIWARAIVEKKSLYSNEPFNVPTGHIPIFRDLAVPIISQGNCIGLIQVANKTINYHEQDQKLLEKIADYIAPILNARLERDAHEGERRRAENKLHNKIEELEQAETILKQQAQIINQTHDSVIMTDLKGHITFWNRGAENLFGYRAEDITGRYISFLYPEEDKEKILREVIAPLKEKGNHEAELRQVRQSGEIIFIHLSLSLVKDLNDNVTGMIGYSIDITERRRAEEALRARQGEIEDLNANLEGRVRDELEKSRQKDLIMMHQSRLAAMGEMIGHIAHQWRQPLNGLILILYNLKDYYADNELTEEMFDDLFERGKKMIEKMSTTIDDFRNFYRPTKGKKDYSVNEVVSECLSLLDASFRYNNISVKINEGETITTFGFPNEYSQVVLNILNNARDAIAVKEMDGSIRIDILREDHFAVVKIIDNGGGICEGIINKIFDPYFTTKEEGKGTGIGLYMCKVIIEDHMYGYIDARNVDGGAEFKVSIPITRDGLIAQEY